MVDVHPVVDIYSSDCARTIVCGEATEKQNELMQIYREAEQSIIANVKPGWKVGDVTKSFTMLRC